MSNYININNKNTVEERDEQDEQDNECMICFENVNTQLTYVKCHNCYKLFHRHCMDDWKNKKQQAFSVCIHCTKDELLLHETITTCCCFKWPKIKSTIKSTIKSRKNITSYD